MKIPKLGTKGTKIANGFSKGLGVAGGIADLVAINNRHEKHKETAGAISGGAKVLSDTFSSFESEEEVEPTNTNHIPKGDAAPSVLDQSTVKGNEGYGVNDSLSGKYLPDRSDVKTYTADKRVGGGESIFNNDPVKKADTPVTLEKRLGPVNYSEKPYSPVDLTGNIPKYGKGVNKKSKYANR